MAVSSSGSVSASSRWTADGRRHCRGLGFLPHGREQRQIVGEPARGRSAPRSPPSRLSTVVARRSTALRQPGEPRHVDAVGAVGGAGGDLVQEHDVAAPLLDPQRVAGQTRQLRRQGGQLVKVGGEQRRGSD